MKPSKKQLDFKSGLRQRYLAIFDEITQKKGIQDKDLCEELDIPASTLSAIRRADRTPTTEQLYSICQKYNYDLNELITGSKKPQTRKIPSGITLETLYAEIQELKALLLKR